MGDADARDDCRDTVVEQQSFASELVLMPGIAHLLGMDDLPYVVDRGTDRDAFSIERESETVSHSIAKQDGGFEHELVMANEPSRCAEIGQEPKRANGRHRLRHLD